MDIFVKGLVTLVINILLLFTNVYGPFLTFGTVFHFILFLFSLVDLILNILVQLVQFY